MKIIFFLLLQVFCFSSITNLIDNVDFTNQISSEKIKEFIKLFPKNKLTISQIDYIIYQSIYYQISPLVVLAKLEQETGLISNPTFDRYNWRLNRCMGYGLYIKKWINGKKYYKYGGFHLQVAHGVRILRKFYDKYNETKIITLKCVSSKIKPKNAAAYSLYCYTPFYGKHNTYDRLAHGNEAFEIIYKRFKKKYNKK